LRRLDKIDPVLLGLPLQNLSVGGPGHLLNREMPHAVVTDGIDRDAVALVEPGVLLPEGAHDVGVARTGSQQGRTRVSEIRFTAVQAWASQLATKRGPVVVQTAYSVLARILDDAVQDRLLASNPARNVKLPKRPPGATCI
jgi:hypothetical protein